MSPRPPTFAFECPFLVPNVPRRDRRTPRSFTEVLEKMRVHLGEEGYTQIPQLSSMNPIDVSAKSDLVPDTATGTRRALMIGINYVGEFRMHVLGSFVRP